MAQITIETDALIIGTEFKKATEEWTSREGKVISAQPDRYYVYFAIGTFQKNAEVLRGKPVIKECQVTKEVFESISTVEKTRVTIDLVDSFENYKTKIVSCEDYAVGV